MKFEDYQNQIIIEILELPSSIKITTLPGMQTKLDSIRRLLDFRLRSERLEGGPPLKFSFGESQIDYLIIQGDCVQAINELNKMKLLSETVKNKILQEYTTQAMNTIQHIVEIASSNEKKLLCVNIKKYCDKIIQGNFTTFVI